MNHLNPGLISAYNSLTDKHLAGYFSNIRMRRHLQRAGLITRSGRIVQDREYRHKQIQRTHQRHVRECLAQAIFHQVLEMERVHHKEIKRRLEEFARRERVNKIKAECSKRYEEDITRTLSPHPPTGARGFQKQHSGPEGEHSESSESPGSSRPNTAPEKMQQPVRLKPIHSNSTTATLRYSSPRRRFETSKENDRPFNSTMESRRRLNRMEASHGISPYCLPVINDFVTPVPPATKRKESGSKVTASSTVRGRTFRPATSFNGADDPPMLRSSVHQSRVSVNMMYLGKTVHLSHDLIDRRDEVKVFQQHCGGENLCVYKGMLHEGESFRFISRRHRGFPFSLTFYLNGLQVERVSSCCEFKHRKGSRLSSRHRHFGFSSVAGASPCYKCIIAMGLDKKSTPPPKRVREDGGGDKSVFSPEDAREKTREDPASHMECEISQWQGMETKVKGEKAAGEDKVRDDYEEDFEADDEGPAEEEEANKKKSPSPSCESERQVKERDTSETDDDERDEDIKSSSSSSFSGSDREESDDEADKDSGEDEKAETPEEVDEEVLKPGEMDEPNPEEATPTEIESAVAKDSDIQDSAGDSTEFDISDTTSVPSGNKNKKNDGALEDKEVEKVVDESKQEEQERAKSVQEKLAEAILKESRCSSEPELSDTTTEEEEEEEIADKGPQEDNKNAVPETLTEETSDPKEREDETKQELHQNSDGTKDEMVEVVEDDEKAESVDNTAANNKTEDTVDRGEHPVCEEEMYDKTSEPREDAACKSTDTAEKEEEQEKTAADADTQPKKPGEEEHESSVSEPNKKSDERAVSNDAEAEAMTASQTMEMKSEASEERVATRCEEAPVTNTDKRQQGDSEDREAASETEVAADNSSSSLEGSGDTTVEKAAETNEDKAKDESNNDDIKEEDESAGGGRREKQEGCDLGAEQAERSVRIDDEVEEDLQKSEDGGKEEENQTNPDELPEAGNSEEHKVDGKDNESKSDTNNEEKANEQAEKICSEEDKAATEERADESERAEKDEDSECVKNKNPTEEAAENGAASDKTNESEKIREINTAANEEKGDEVEKNENENDAEPSEAAEHKCNEESEEIKVPPDETLPEEELLESAEGPEKTTDTDPKEDDVKITDEKEKSDDVGESEAANMAAIEETVNKAVEVEDVTKERGSEKSVNGDDAENVEISSRAENSVQDEGEAQTEIKGHVETAEHGEDETKTKEPDENERREAKEEANVDSAVEKHEDDEVDEAPDNDVPESEAKKDESTKCKSESETSVTDVKEEFKSDGRKDGEESKQDENGNISSRDHEKKDSDLIENSSVIQSDVTDVKAASLGDQDQSSVPMDVDLDGTATKLEESTKPARTDGYPQTNEDTAVVDLSVTADGENEDTEALSKASEEGASVLLKPQTPSSPMTRNNKAENTGECVAGSNDTPDALAGEDNLDLVQNWVTQHQASKFFETFVEHLEDLRECDAQESNTTESAKLSGSESLRKMRKIEENAEQEQTGMDVNESRDDTKEEAVESDLKSDRSEDGKLKTLQVEEETDVTELIPEAESEQCDDKSVKGEDVRSGEHKGSRGSVEEGKVKEGSVQGIPEQSDISKTEVESIAGTHHSVTSGRSQIVSEILNEEKAIDKGPEFSKRQTFKGLKDALASSEAEGHRKYSTSPEGLSERDRKEQEGTEETWGKGQEVTEITDFTEDGSHEDSRHRETQPKSSEVRIDGRDRRETQTVPDIQHALSKDGLSIFSADETPFGHSSYPLLTAARTESERQSCTSECH